jgi:hypothetical protein
VRPFTDKQIELLTTFADQAVIAIENVRLFDEVQARTRELSESLEQQTATSEILSVISNSVSHAQPVFDAIVASGRKLFPDGTILVTLADEDTVDAAAIAAPDAAYIEAIRKRLPLPLTREYMHSAAILDRQIVDIPDVENPPAELAAGAQNFLKTGYRAVTIMPMLRGAAAIGALSVMRLAPGPLSDKQHALLKTFANQAVIAIESTRLLNELRESLCPLLAQSGHSGTPAVCPLSGVKRTPSGLKRDQRPVVISAVAENDARYVVQSGGAANGGPERWNSTHIVPLLIASCAPCDEPDGLHRQRLGRHHRRGECERSGNDGRRFHSEIFSLLLAPPAFGERCHRSLAPTYAGRLKSPPLVVSAACPNETILSGQYPGNSVCPENENA